MEKPEQKAVDMLSEHLPYEIDMFEFAYSRLCSNFPDTPAGRFEKNSLIECFWLHARNLNEFLTAPPKNDFKKGVASARDFAPQFQSDKQLEQLDDLVNVQITHLQYDREKTEDKKLGGYDIQRVKETIDRELGWFMTKLTDLFKDHWRPRGQVQVGDNFPVAGSSSAFTQEFLRQGTTGPVDWHDHPSKRDTNRGR